MGVGDMRDRVVLARRAVATSCRTDLGFEGATVWGMIKTRSRFDHHTSKIGD